QRRPRDMPRSAGLRMLPCGLHRGDAERVQDRSLPLTPSPLQGTFAPMRRVLPVLVLSSVLLSACGGEEPKPVVPTPSVEPPQPPPIALEPIPMTPSAAPKPSLAELQKTGLATALQGLNGHDPKMF